MDKSRLAKLKSNSTIRVELHYKYTGSIENSPNVPPQGFSNGEIQVQSNYRQL